MVWITRALSLIILTEAFAIVVLCFAYTIIVIWKEIRDEGKSLEKPEEDAESREG